MKVVTAGGATIDLGTTETTPTISITDYSRRVTDDFGVTTVVERGFARRMSVRLALPFDGVDALQRRLADLRATAATWVADDRFAWLSVRGFYRDFELDLAVPPLSYCTLTVEGLAETEVGADPGGDPAPEGLTSTMQLLQPVTVGEAQLVASSVSENDAPAWAADAVYAMGARVVRARRVYESLIPSNAGKQPDTTPAAWLDTGPTGRWAMFDEALGTATEAAGQIVVRLSAGAPRALALLDTVAATVRVQAPGYERSQAAGAGAITFLDLPGVAGDVVVTIAGPGTVSVGTLLIGGLARLGATEANPSASITDFSRKEVDDFGEVTIVKRGFAKRMTARALIRTDAIDLVANRVAAVRAKPSLWIGQDGLDSLTVYGFFKDFSIEGGETVSKVALSIEGLSTAQKIEPLTGPVNWPDIIDSDPARPKPQDGADKTSENTAKDTAFVNGRPAQELISDLRETGLGVVQALLNAENAGRLALDIGYSDGQAVSVAFNQLKEDVRTEISALGSVITTIVAKTPDGTAYTLNADQVYVGPDKTLAQSIREVGATNSAILDSAKRAEARVTSIEKAVLNPDGTGYARASLSLDVNGVVAGFSAFNDGRTTDFSIMARVFKIVDDSTGEAVVPFSVANGIVRATNFEADRITYGALVDKFAGDRQLLDPNGGWQELPGGFILQWGRYRNTIVYEQPFDMPFPRRFPTMCFIVIPVGWLAAPSAFKDLWLQNVGVPSQDRATFFAQAATSDNRTIDGFDWVAFGR